jgi:hypothetical protein
MHACIEPYSNPRLPPSVHRTFIDEHHPLFQQRKSAEDRAQSQTSSHYASRLLQCPVKADRYRTTNPRRVSFYLPRLAVGRCEIPHSYRLQTAGPAQTIVSLSRPTTLDEYTVPVLPMRWDVLCLSFISLLNVEGKPILRTVISQCNTI